MSAFFMFVFSRSEANSYIATFAQLRCKYAGKKAKEKCYSSCPTLCTYPHTPTHRERKKDGETFFAKKDPLVFCPKTQYGQDNLGTQDSKEKGREFHPPNKLPSGHTHSHSQVNSPDLQNERKKRSIKTVQSKQACPKLNILT